MLTTATYKIPDGVEDVDSERFLYDAGDNTPERAAIKFKNMLTIYHADDNASPADAFIKAERINALKAPFRNSHEEDHATTYRYTLDASLQTHSLILTVETIRRDYWRKKPLIRLFFQGPLTEFIDLYSPSLSFTTGLYQIQEKEGIEFYADEGNNPCEAAYRLALMNGLRRSGKRAYTDAFRQANDDATVYLDTPSWDSSADYLYVLEPLKDEEGSKDLILSAYGDGSARRLFFKGCLKEFILIFGKN